MVHGVFKAEKGGIELLVSRASVEVLEILQYVCQGGGAKSFCNQFTATGVEGGVDDLFINLCRYYYQVFKCFSLIILDFPFFSSIHFFISVIAVTGIS